MELIDIGANLGHAAFRHDLSPVLSRARQAGLAHIMVTGTDLESSEGAISLSRAHPGFLSATAGFHPHHAAQCTPEKMTCIKQLCAAPEVVAPEVVAIGETGLDYNRDYSPRPAQRQAFEMHLALAAETGKPLFLHQRDAHEDFHAILKDWRDRIIGGVVHCFTDSTEALSAYLDLDMHIGITGWICDERRGRALQQSVGHIPADRLLIETDAPYLLPRSLLNSPSPPPDPRRNEPAYLPEVLRTVAQHRNEDPQKTAATTTTNARRLFNLNRHSRESGNPEQKPPAPEAQRQSR